MKHLKSPEDTHESLRADCTEQRQSRYDCMHAYHALVLEGRLVRDLVARCALLWVWLHARSCDMHWTKQGESDLIL